MRTFYRGAMSFTPTDTKPTHWTMSKKMATDYANLRQGSVFSANLYPRRYLVGNESSQAKKLGIYREWVRIRADDPLKADRLLEKTAKVAGYDALVYSNQVVVLNPRVIKLKTIRRRGNGSELLR